MNPTSAPNGGGHRLLRQPPARRRVLEDDDMAQAQPTSASPGSFYDGVPQANFGNSLVFRRRLRRKIDQIAEPANTIPIGQLQHLPQSFRQQAVYARETSDSWDWIQQFNQPTQKYPSSIFNKLLDHPDLLYAVCHWLEPEDLVSLYAISKDFHIMINTQFTTFALDFARTRCPESAKIFHFKCYQNLCMLDASQNKSEDRKGTIRDIPSMKWIRMIIYRDRAVDGIIRSLALKGLRLPKHASIVLKKLWFIMDLPDSRRRIGVIHNPSLWTDVELFIAAMFFMKLDMACTDPMDGCGERRIRQLLMAQRGLDMTDKVLRRTRMRNQYELLQMHVQWDFARADMPPPGMRIGPRTVFGVQLWDCARLKGENWRSWAPKLMRPDELVFKEAIRRELRFQDKIIDMMLWGNLHPVTGKDVFPTNEKGEVQVVFDAETEKVVMRELTVFSSKKGVQFDWDAQTWAETAGERAMDLSI